MILEKLEFGSVDNIVQVVSDDELEVVDMLDEPTMALETRVTVHHQVSSC